MASNSESWIDKIRGFFQNRKKSEKLYMSLLFTVYTASYVTASVGLGNAKFYKNFTQNFIDSDFRVGYWISAGAIYIILFAVMYFIFLHLAWQTAIAAYFDGLGPRMKIFGKDCFRFIGFVIFPIISVNLDEAVSPKEGKMDYIISVMLHEVGSPVGSPIEGNKNYGPLMLVGGIVVCIYCALIFFETLDDGGLSDAMMAVFLGLIIHVPRGNWMLLPAAGASKILIPHLFTLLRDWVDQPVENVSNPTNPTNTGSMKGESFAEAVRCRN